MLIIDMSEPVKSYKSYKSEKFNKTKNRISQLLKGIDDLSLKKDDKDKLILEIKKIVNDF